MHLISVAKETNGTSLPNCSRPFIMRLLFLQRARHIIFFSEDDICPEVLSLYGISRHSVRGYIPDSLRLLFVK
jgi:hypothetical protein